MELVSDKNLIDLAYNFERSGFRLYAVGGFVRDRLLGISEESCSDIDLCSRATIEELQALAVDCDMLVSVMNKQFGVAKIFYGGRVYEHATLRREICSDKGGHYPKKVEFVSNLELDYKRRDFTVSAVYYDIYHGKVVDFCGGEGDIKKHLLRAVGNADLRIKEDAERILRAIRFKISYGFEFDEELKSAIAKNAELLWRLSDTRKYKETIRILMCDNVNGNHFDILDNSGVLRTLFPSIYDLSLNRKAEYKKIKMALDIESVFRIPAIIALVKNAEEGASEEELSDILKLEKHYCKDDKKLQNYVKIFEIFTKKSLKTLELREIIEDNMFKYDDLIYCAQELYSSKINKRIIKQLGILIKS
ncbi:MAG: CCA tRNA nucleotidyltransferase [Clostridia bacterium]|nr:CCA tRNA nucleotidyltransferase [Clostridia bacterium]